MRFKNLTLFFLFSSCLFTLVNAQEIAECQVNFTSDSYELSPEAKATLDNLIQLTHNAIDFTFHLKGHTDLDGSLAYNEDLSEKRNLAVQAYLLQQGIDLSAISLNAYGERKPLQNLETELAKAINRRVEVLLTYDPVNSVKEMLSHFAKQREQHFIIDCQQGGEVTANDGTIVRIPTDAFVHADGSPVSTGTVDVMIEEAVRPSAMVFHQLNTTHGDHALATGGMIRLSAIADGKPLNLRDDKALAVFVPTTDADPSMRLYDGSRDEAGAMVWEELEAPVNVLTSAEVQASPVAFPQHIFTALDQIEVKIPTHPGRLMELPLPAIPKMAEPTTKRLQKPYKPGVPQRQISKAPKGFFAKMKYDEAKEQAKLDLQFEQRKAKYAERMATYEEALVNYAENQKVYNQELAAIKANYKIEKAAVIEERKAKIQAWLAQCYTFEAAHRLQSRIDRYKKDLSRETIHEKLFPNRKNKPIETYQFSISLKALDYFARGEHMPPNIEPQYSKYLIAANNAAQRLLVSVGFDQLWSQIKRDYLSYQDEKALSLRNQNNAAISSLESKVNYYGYQVSAPNFSRWCNIDTPIPMGQSLLAFDNTRFTEMFTFVPASKMVNYFPIKKIKTAFFPAGQQINYLAFRYVNDGVQLATGKLRPRNRERINLAYRESSLAEIEQAILALDM